MLAKADSLLVPADVITVSLHCKQGLAIRCWQLNVVTLIICLMSELSKQLDNVLQLGALKSPILNE